MHCTGWLTLQFRWSFSHSTICCMPTLTLLIDPGEIRTRVTCPAQVLGVPTTLCGHRRHHSGGRWVTAWLANPDFSRGYSIIYNIYTAGWWFGTFFIFPNTWDDDPIWLIFFRGVETTNQYLYIYIWLYKCNIIICPKNVLCTVRTSVTYVTYIY